MFTSILLIFLKYLPLKSDILAWRPQGALKEGGVEFDNLFFVLDLKRKSKKKIWAGQINPSQNFWMGLFF